ncbi:MAG: hypothetical protein JEZ09_12595 [Salinivirgaceae bacterium]|nr:hypothetical protein [Salinivirgaceae bacterium]
MCKLKNTKTSAIIIAFLMCVQPLFSQKKKDSIADEYRRSSLHIILLESKNFENSDLVLQGYHKAPFPDKYNDHRLSEVMFNPETYGLSEEEIGEKAEKDSTAKENGEKVKMAEKKTPSVIEKYFKENDIAKQMVAKWFNRQEDGTFDMSLIHERGSYDASALEADIAKGSIRGVAALKDAGEELIKNSFIAVNKMHFVKNEYAALAVRTAAYISADRLPKGSKLAKMAADKVYEATKDGYSVWATSYLYQLEWNDDIANQFYMDMWMDKSSIDETRKQLFDTTSIFKMNYIGFEKAKSLVLIGEGKELALIIELATVRNIDKVYTKLQKTYDVFKTKTPIYGVDPIWAKIGLKEGVEPNDKFEVLEQVIDKKTGLTVYKQVGVVKVDKKNIWDNRYYMEELGDVDDLGDESVDGKKDIEGTYFKGSSKIEPGMLLRQVK